MRCLEGLSEEDAIRRLESMNCISWIVGHLAAQEHLYWVIQAQGRVIFPDLHKLVGWGSPPSTPPLHEMWDAWRAITGAADGYLDTLAPEAMQRPLEWDESADPETAGTKLFRNIYHYWYHLGEAHAIRSMLGHTDLPGFIGDMSQVAYRPET